MKQSGIRLLSLFMAMVVVIGLFAGVPVSAAETDTVIYDLRVNDQRNPIGVDDSKPTFSWKMKSDTVGAMQTA